MAMRRADADQATAASTIRVSPDLAAWLVHRDYRARPSRQWSLVEVGGPSLCLRLTVEEAEGLRDALAELLARVSPLKRPRQARLLTTPSATPCPADPRSSGRRAGA